VFGNISAIHIQSSSVYVQRKKAPIVKNGQKGPLLTVIIKKVR